MAVALSLLTACGDDGTAASSGPSVSASSTPSSSSASSAPSAPSAPVTDVQEPSGAYDLVLERVRASRHGYGTRVVLTFAGRGSPGWTARYVDEAVLEGSGDVVDLGGDQVLRLDITGTPTVQSDELRPIRTRTGGDVVDLRGVAAWEGVAQVFIGLEGEAAAFRAVELSEPSRIVVDID